MSLQDSKHHHLVSQSRMQGTMMKGMSLEPGILDPEGEDEEFFNCDPLIEVDDMTMIESSMDRFDEVGFDAATYCGIWTENSLRIIMYKLFKVYEIFPQFEVSLKSLINYTLEIQAGYFNENEYHN